MENFLDVALPMAKEKKKNDDVHLNLPKLTERVEFGTESSYMREYYENQEKQVKEMKLETFRERQHDEDSGMWDQFEYMNTCLCTDDSPLVEGYELELMFTYNDGESKLI